MTGVFLASLVLVTPYLRGDGTGYYAYISSLITDGDLNFEDEYSHMDPARYRLHFDETGNIRELAYTPTGKVVNHYPVGPSLLWSPFFISAHAFVLLHNVIRPGNPIIADGFSKPYLFLCAIGTAIYGFAGLLICYYMAKKLFGRIPALIAVFSIWFASSLLVYMYFLPFLSHAFSTFVCSLFILLWWRVHETNRTRDWVFLGLVAGLMPTIHHLNGILLVFIAFSFLEMLRARRIKDFGINALLFSSSFVVGILPNLVAKYILYGFPLIDVDAYSFWHFTSPRLIKVLFSSEHGLWTWTPILFLACLGFIPLTRRDKALGWRAIATFLVFWYFVASWGSWHGQSSFGNRFFISLTPIFILGLAAGINYLLRSDVLKVFSWKLKLFLTAGIIVILIFWNFGFIFQWGANMIPNRGPISWRTMIHNQFTAVPTRAASMAKGFFTSRTKLISDIESEDMEEIRHYRKGR